ncbi:MAG: PEP-CTERM sorting domain-containing protein [bacterium]
MVRRWFIGFAAAVALSVPLSTAVAQPSSNVPGLHASYLQPTGTGTTHDAFDIWIRLTLDAGANPFMFDGDSPGTNFGIPGLTLPSQGSYFDGTNYQSLAFDSYSFARTTVALECSGTFFTSCGGTPYVFDFYYCGALAPCFLGQNTFTMAPGSTYDYLFGTLTPAGGTAPAGTYNLYNAATWLSVVGTGHEVDANGNDVLDANGNQILHTDLNAYVDLAVTCGAGANNPSCNFIRTTTDDTVVTPEPATLGLVGLGLFAIGGLRRRRSR